MLDHHMLGRGIHSLPAHQECNHQECSHHHSGCPHMVVDHSVRLPSLDLVWIPKISLGIQNQVDEDEGGEDGEAEVVVVTKEAQMVEVRDDITSLPRRDQKEALTADIRIAEIGMILDMTIDVQTAGETAGGMIEKRGRERGEAVEEKVEGMTDATEVDLLTREDDIDKAFYTRILLKQ